MVLPTWNMGCVARVSELQLGWSGWAEELQGYVRPQETLKATEKEATVSGMFFFL